MLSSVLGSFFWLVVTLGVLITFHEFGHFWVARRCGVKVKRFSVGFGPALWRHRGKDGTEYQVAAIPLGGYVQMHDARTSEVPIAHRDAAFWKGEFTTKPVSQRLAIVAAGPAFNVIFTLVAFWVMFLLGALSIAPVVTPTPQGLAAQAGMRAHDHILKINDVPVASFNAALETLAPFITAHQPIQVTVQADHEAPRTVLLPLDRLQANQELSQDIKDLGIKPSPPTPFVEKVAPGGPASLAGIRDGDLILSLNGQSVTDFADLRHKLNAAAPTNPKVTVQVKRGTAVMAFTPTARQEKQDDKQVWVIGIQSAGPAMVIERHGPWGAALAAVSTTWSSTTQTLTMMKQLVVGQSSAKNVSGVIGIAQAADNSASMGVPTFLQFLALISLNLAIVNLFPIPVLDGGHLLFYLIEVVKGSPLNERWVDMSQRVGLMLLCGLMGLAFYNDIHRLIVQLVS